MALHPNFPSDPHAILDPAIRWFPADEALRERRSDQLMPPLVPCLRREVKAWRERGYEGAADTSKSLLRWWFSAAASTCRRRTARWQEFRYYFAQREALETIVYLYDVVGVKDKYDLMRFDSSGAVKAGMFDETWRRFVVKMATGAGKTKVLSLVLAWSFFHKTLRAGFASWPAISGDCAEHHRAGPHPQGFRRPENFLSGPHTARQRLRRPQLARRLPADAAHPGRSARGAEDGQHLPHEHPPRVRRQRVAFLRRTTRTRWTISSARGPAARPPTAKWTWA